MQTYASACRPPAETRLPKPLPPNTLPLARHPTHPHPHPLLLATHPKPLPPYPLPLTNNPTHQNPHPSWMAGDLMRRIVKSVNKSLTWLAQGTSVPSSQVIRLAAGSYKRPDSQALRKHHPDVRRSESLPPPELAVTDPDPGISW